MLTLTPQARAIGLLVLAFLSITGGINRVGVAVAGVINAVADPGGKTFAVVIALITTAIATSVVVLATQNAAKLDPGWAHAMSQAAVLLAVVGSGIAVLDLIAAVVGDGYSSGTYSFG